MWKFVTDRCLYATVATAVLQNIRKESNISYPEHCDDECKGNDEVDEDDEHAAID